MPSEDTYVKAVRQIIPSSGLWLRYDEARENVGEAFLPVVAIAHCEIESPHPTFFTDSFFMPITSSELMYGLVEHKPFEGMRFTYTIYHDADFEEVGVRLKPGVRPRSVVGIPDGELKSVRPERGNEPA